MRNDGNLDDPLGSGRTADRSDDTPSANRLATLRGLVRRTRFWAPTNARPGRTKLAVATGAACCLGLVGASQAGFGAPDRAAAPAPSAEVAERAAVDPASRAMARPSTAPTTPSASPSVTASPKATAKPKPKKTVRQIVPVAGLDRTQMNNAKKIVQAGKEMGVPRRALVIAVATAMQESTLLNYASGVLPESQSYPHQAIGWDHDSVGLFQQRPSSGWGTVEQLMDPEYATKAFLSALAEIPGWQNLPLSVAAQAVQISAFPDAYAQHEWRAGEVVAEILG
ncbi:MULTISPECIES: peptidase M23 [unclassified Micromonospora]|uniref:peptidase M23 n=1 Tax=unclassified Micromonospora TaxID=2617518 RepID=UPI001C21DE55|nr:MULTISPECIES: peptidase M23 [unclassified Micromonospora]MBU8859957.1 peptidase M23 [Micromonospora sp. WMMB482]MDM4779482.1 peptidase M23 [Micromonospora sp. b486]